MGSSQYRTIRIKTCVSCVYFKPLRYAFSVILDRRLVQQRPRELLRVPVIPEWPVFAGRGFDVPTVIHDVEVTIDMGRRRKSSVSTDNLVSCASAHAALTRLCFPVSYYRVQIFPICFYSTSECCKMFQIRTRGRAGFPDWLVSGSRGSPRLVRMGGTLTNPSVEAWRVGSLFQVIAFPLPSFSSGLAAGGGRPPVVGPVHPLSLPGS